MDNQIVYKINSRLFGGYDWLVENYGNVFVNSASGTARTYRGALRQVRKHIELFSLANNTDTCRGPDGQATPM